MLQIFISVLGIVLTILFVVGTHEAGHFAVARLCGVKVLTFSIGFGKRIFSWHDKSGTEYVVAWIPLGGYVRMLDETEANVAQDERHLAYNNQPFYKKFLIVAAGPFTNLLCAFLLYWFIFSYGFITAKPVIGEVTPNSIAAASGIKPMQEITNIDDHKVESWTTVIFQLLRHTGDKDKLIVTTQGINDKKTQTYTLSLADWKMDDLNPDPMGSLGITPYEPPLKLVIGHIAKDSPAQKSRLAIGDKIIAINKEKIKDWMQISKIIHEHPDQELIFAVERGNKKMDVPVVTGSKYNWRLQKHGIIGIGPEVKMPEIMQQKVKYTILGGIPRAYEEVDTLIRFNLLLFGKLLTGKLSVASLGGPITIFSTASNSLNYGLLPFLSFLAFLSISIGIINIFPIPGLDGGHLLIQTIESVTRRKISTALLVLLFKIGFIFLFVVMIQALMNDIMRLL